jgi:hypothetical protein
MRQRFRKQVDELVASVTQQEGHLPAATRAELVRGKPVSGALGGFAARVSQDSFTITDANIKALRDAGFDDDQIFECIIAAALGAGLERLEKGLRLLGLDS